jgi:hypothetical protein
LLDQEYCWEGASPDIAVARALWALNYSQAFATDTRTKTWLAELKERYGLADAWDDLSRHANEMAWKEVFGDGATALETASKLAVGAISDRTRFARRRWRCSSVPCKLRMLGYTSPVIYGHGKRGKELEYILSGAGIEIAAIVDRENQKFSKIEQVPASTGADVIIVSVLDSAEIMADLRGKTDLPLFTLEELLEQ